jgi:putative transposase
VPELRQNAYAESFFRTLKVEEVYLLEYETFADAERGVKAFIEIVYTKKRLHSSLEYQTPAEFESAWRRTHAAVTLNPGIGKTSVLAVS